MTKETAEKAQQLLQAARSIRATLTQTEHRLSSALVSLEQEKRRVKAAQEWVVEIEKNIAENQSRLAQVEEELAAL